MVRNILINEHITVITGQLLTTPSTVSGNKEQYGILSSIHNNVVNNTQLSSRRTVGKPNKLSGERYIYNSKT